MSADLCFEARDAAAILALDEDHPRRRHARECPRCGALLEEYAAYALADPGPVPADELAAADARLTRALADAIGEPHAAAPRARPAHGPLAAWRRLLHPAMRPALAFAALAVVLGAAALVPRWGRWERGVVLRGDARVVSLALERAERSGGALHLSWRPCPGADAYELRFFSTELAEIGRVGPLHATRADMTPATLPFPLPPDRPLLVRVVALAGGDVIATSDALPVASR